MIDYSSLKTHGCRLIDLERQGDLARKGERTMGATESRSEGRRLWPRKIRP